MANTAVDNKESVNNLKYGHVAHSSSTVEEECERGGEIRWRQVNYDLIVVEWPRERWGRSDFPQ